MKSRYLFSMSSRMCFLSRLTGSGVKSGLLRSSTNLQHKNTEHNVRNSSHPPKKDINLSQIFISDIHTNTT